MSRFALLLCAVAAVCVAQDWVCLTGFGSISGEAGYDVVSDGQGGAYSCGTMQGYGNYPMPAVAHYSPSGTRLWTKVYTVLPLMINWVPKLAVTASGSIVMYAHTTSNGRSLLTGCSPAGESLWAYQCGAESLGGNSLDVFADSRGFVYTTGTVTNDSGNTDICTAKFTENGQLQWMEFYNGPRHGTDVAYAIDVDTAGNVYVAGSAENLLRKVKPALLKYLPDGTLSWSRLLGPEGVNLGTYRDVAATKDGFVYAAGVDRYYVSKAPVAKYSANGDSMWAVSNPTRADIYSIVVDAQDNVYATGWVYDIITWKFSPAGAILWCDTVDGPGHTEDEGDDIALDPNGNAVVTGYCSNDLVRGFQTVKYSPSGERLWSLWYSHDETGAGRAVCTDTEGNVFVTGSAYDTTALPRTELWVTMKYRSSGAVGELGQARVAVGSAIKAEPSVVRGTCGLTLGSAKMAQAFEIRDLAGRVVRSLPVTGAGGEARATWDATDEAGRLVPNGVYFVTCVPSGPCPAKLVVRR